MAIHNIHGDSIHGDLSSTDVTLRKRPGHISEVEGAKIEQNFYQKEIDRRYQDLPALKNNNATINFLGSSFSGVDIKVIAHMYDSKNWNEGKLNQLNEKLAIAEAVRDACSTLLQSGLAQLGIEDPSSLSHSTQRDVFLAAAGFGGNSASQVNTATPEVHQAMQIVVANVFSFGSFTFIGLAQMRRRANRLRQAQEEVINEYRNRVEHVKSLGSVESSSTIALGSLQTISIQTFREKNAVRALGHAYAKGYTRGTRTIGGSCIFTIFNQNALAGLISALGKSPYYAEGTRDNELSMLIPDQLPPLDLTIVFANEYGALSDFRLYGVEFFTDGSVFSIEDLLSEETMNFVCHDADIMTSRGRVRISRLQRGMFNDKDDKDASGSSLLFDNQAYYEYLDRLGVRRRLLNR